MTLPSSGAISMSNVDVELGLSSTATITLNDAAVRNLFGKSSGQISMSDGWGKSAIVYITINIPNTSKNYNIFSNRGGSYVAGKSVVTAVVGAGYTVGSTSTGTYALDTGSGWSSGDILNITNNGYIAGMGGAGGTGQMMPSCVPGNNGGGGGAGTNPGPRGAYGIADGGLTQGGAAGAGAGGNLGVGGANGHRSSGSCPQMGGLCGGPGAAGGPALYLQWPITTFTNSSGYVYSGGGGGGGGNSGGAGGGGGAIGGSGGCWVCTDEGGLVTGFGGAGGGHGLAIQRNGYTINGTTTLTRTYGGIS